MNTLLSIAAGAVLVSTVALSSVQATTATGQIEAGDIYQAKTINKDVTFVDPTNATCGDVVKLRVVIHNPGPVALENVKVVAKLPTATGTTHGSTATVTASNANPASTSDSVTVKTDKAAKLSYVSGSAEYFNATGGREGSIDDSVVTTGATVPGGVGVSFEHTRYVQFQVKVDCPTTPVTPTTPETPKVKETPKATVVTELPRTGSEGVIAVVASLIAAAAGYVVTARKNVLG